MSRDANSHSYNPPGGIVSSKETAIRMAEVVLGPIYGEANIAAQRPFVATLKAGVWLVSGTLPADMLGGTAYIEIAQADGRVITVSHSQ
jgi:hypothetical protein